MTKQKQNQNRQTSRAELSLTNSNPFQAAPSPAARQVEINRNT